MTILQYPTDKLQVHPQRQALPFQSANPATLASVAEIGVREAIKVARMSDEEGEPTGLLYVVDGLDRLKGAVDAMIATVPVQIIAQSEVQATLLHSLLARKHLTKSALAFVAFPLFEPAMEEARERRLAILKSGGKSIVVSNDYAPKKLEELAQILGVHRDMLFKARNVHGFLKKVSKAKRTEIEGRILSGEMDLTAAIHSLSGNESTAGKDRTTPGQLELFDRDFSSITARWQKWESLGEPQRQHVASKFAALIEEAPEEIVQAVIKRLEKGAK